MKCRGVLWLVVLQLGAAPGYAQQPDPEKLAIAIIEGEGAINNIRSRNSRNITVQVNDEHSRPVAGAAVVFTLPSQGAGGVFDKGRNTSTVVADSEGRATVRGFRPNRIPGKMEIRVNASWQGRTARATITQFNMLVEGAADGRKSRAGRTALILAVVGAAAAGGAIAATRGSSGAAQAAVPPNLITITPGTGTMGPPQ
jgi:hypothetical protein